MADSADGGRSAHDDRGVGLNRFIAALSVSIIVFAVQVLVFLLLRNKLARIFKPKTYLAPERERTEPPPRSPISLIRTLWNFSERDVINKCGLDAYFFLRYLRTLLVIFVPIACVTVPVLVPLNYMSGIGNGFLDDDGDSNSGNPQGLDTLAWGNITPENHQRHWAHLILAIGVISWVCVVFYFELRVYVKIRQDYLTSAEHRLRASATTVLVNNIPSKWLTEVALRGLFDVFPGGIRNVWLNRDLSKLMEKIEMRDSIHRQLELAETDLIKKAKKNQLKQRKKDDKKSRRRSRAGALTKKELEQRAREEDENARRMAQSGQGVSAGAHDDVPHDVAQVVEEVREEDRQRRHSHAPVEGAYGHEPHDSQGKGFGFGFLGDGITKVGQGIRGGVGRIGQGLDSEVTTTNGFTRLDSPRADESASTAFPRPSADHPRVQALRQDDTRIGSTSNITEQTVPSDASRPQSSRSRGGSVASQDSSHFTQVKSETTANGNTVRQVSNLDNMYDNDKRRWYQFWRPPAGAFASPVPQKAAAGENPLNYAEPERTFWQRILYLVGLGGDNLPPLEYAKSTHYTGDKYDEKCEEDALWRQYVKPKHRPTHRLPRWGFPNWLAWLTFGKKVDTIYWCRTELARLNLEIRTDQAHPERYPLMNSAFIQFNDQVAAHMACQSLVHHLPKHMAPRINEVSPKDVIWSNMSIKWWDEWARTAAVTALIVTMVIFWSFPVGWTALLANVDGLTKALPWLGWLKEDPWQGIGGAVSGVLPPALLALLLVLVPIILDMLADFKGAKTGSQKTEFVQKFFFAFLFVQVFLVISVVSFFSQSLETFTENLQKLSNVQEVLRLLATELPGAANYFFAYMLLQAMSVSSGALLQIGTLLVWYVLARIIDSTARNKWTRNTELNHVKWGHMFPVYTNFACIALIYSVIAPLISIFAVITFSLLWAAQKYCLVYVVRAGVDTGGVLYPRAINQAFTGLYFMELCLAGLFFIVTDENGKVAGTARGIIMVVTVPLTILYQVLLNRSFSPLARYLPITMEDEAVIRDRAFEQDQRRRFGLADESELEVDEEKAPVTSMDGGAYRGREDDEIELRGMTRQPKKKLTFNPVKDVANLAMKGGRGLRNLTVDKVEGAAPVKNAAAYRRAQRRKDLESQRAIGEALYGGVADEIEDLMPEERNALIIESFKHHALRARQPTVWIPRDDLGVSDDEIRRTRDYTENVHISNAGTALDSKVRVVYGRNPPDFSEVTLIDL